MSEAMQTPLVDLLRGTPKDGRVCHEESPTSHHFIPYGRLCHDAADTIEALRRERDEAIKVRNDAILENNTSRYELAASQAYSQQLRDTVELLWVTANHEEWDACAVRDIDALLALPQDDTALKQYGAKLLRDAGKKMLLAQGQLNRMADELEAGK